MFESEYYHFAILNEIMVFNIKKRQLDTVHPLKIHNTNYEVFLPSPAPVKKKPKITLNLTE